MEQKMDRTEHLAQCKRTALAYIERGEAMNALTSMFSDLDKHPETAGHVGIALGLQLMMIGSLSNLADAKRYIEGFN